MKRILGAALACALSLTLTGVGAAVAVGESTWSGVAAPSSNDFQDVAMAGEDTVFAVETGIIWKSDDGGVTWEVSLEPGGDTYDVYLNDVDFVDRLNGWAVGYHYSHVVPSERYATIYHTIDGGESWTVESVETDPDFPLFSVDAYSAHRAVAAGTSGIVALTEDGGTTWEPYYEITTDTYNGVSWVSPSSFIAVGENGRITSFDYQESGGWNPHTRTHSGTSADLHEVDFWDDTDGVIVGEGRFFLTTTDGGVNWSRTEWGEWVDPDESYYGVDCVAGGVAYAVGYRTDSSSWSPNTGEVLRIADRGSGYARVDDVAARPEVPLRGVDLASSGEGFAVGDGGAMVELATTEVERLAGADRYATAHEISRGTWADGTADTAVLATGGDFPDALSASGLAGALDAPLLLVGTEVTSALTDELGRLGVTDVYLVGGTGVISLDAEEALADDYTVTRVWGADRYETAAEVAREIESVTGASFTADAFVARGDEFPDALAVAPFAYSQAMPVLLTRPDALPAQTEAVMTDLAVDAAWVAGGTGAVTSPVKDTVDTILNDNGGPSSIRWGGADRYATAADIAGGGISQGWAGTSYIGVATGSDFPDALAGGAACGAMSGSMVLTPSDSLPANVASFISSNAGFDTDVVIYGGEGVVEPDVMSAIEALY